MNLKYKYPIYEPLLEKTDLKNVIDSLENNQISSKGPYVKKFEKKFSSIHHNLDTLAVSNGTVALQLALKSLGIAKGDEVIVPNSTFAAPANAVIDVGAVPVFSDVCRKELIIKPDYFKNLINKKTKAIICVHLYGSPCDMKEILSIAKKKKLFVIEDCAEALGSKYKKRFVGTFGDIGTFSFFGNKTITTGEGGMLLFKNSKHYKKASLLRDHGMSDKKRYWHLISGYNYRLTNIQSALGYGQLTRFSKIINKKIEIAETYKNELRNFKDKLYFIQSPNYKLNTYWLFCIILKKNKADTIIKKLEKYKIEARKIFYPLNKMPAFKKYKNIKGGPLSNSEFLTNYGLCLPSSLKLNKVDIEKICKILKSVI